MANPLLVNHTQSSIPLYEQDYYNWLEKTAKLLQDGKLAELDQLNLAEEIEDMGEVKSGWLIAIWKLYSGIC